MAVVFAYLALVAALAGGPIALAAPPGPLLPAAPSGLAAPTQDQVLITADEVDVDAAYTLAVDSVDDEIDVTVVIDLVLRKSSEVAGQRTVSFALRDWYASLPANATDVTAFDSRGALRVEQADGGAPNAQVVRVHLGRWIFVGRKHQITLSYSFPENRPPLEVSGADRSTRSESDPVVINEATVAWLFATDPGYDRWSAELLVPDDYELVVDDDANSLWDDTGRQRQGSKVWKASGTELELDHIILENDDRMQETVVEIGDHDVTLRHWPGDTAWRDLVADQVADHLPTLTDLIGLPLPDHQLVVEESARTLGTTYGGWFAGSDRTIIIGPTVDATLIPHELSHLWFNYASFQDRWLNEGLAEEFAHLAVFGPDGDGPPETTLSSPHSRPLKEWTVDDLAGDDGISTPDTVQWAYHSSWHVVRETRQLIGLEPFADLTAAVLSGQRSYADRTFSQQVNSLIIDSASIDGDTGSNGSSRDWREFLDLASEYGPEPDLVELYATWVEGKPSALFDHRAAARTQYETLANRADGWVLPEAVRMPMRTWTFDEAAIAMVASDEFLDNIDSHRRRLAGHDLTLPHTVEVDFGSAANIYEMEQVIGRLDQAVNNIAGLDSEVSSLALIEKIGLFGSDLDTSNDQARQQFLDGDFQAAAESADRIDAMIEGGASDGYLRLAGAGTAVLLLTALAALTATKRRSHDGQAAVAAIDLRSIDLTELDKPAGESITVVAVDQSITADDAAATTGAVDADD